MTTALYIRVSTYDKQENGLASQRRALEEYCANHNITNTKTYIDRITGSKMERPALGKLQKDIFKGRIKTIIVWKLDRVARKLMEGLQTLTDWLSRDIRVVAVAQNIDYSGPTGKLMAAMLFAIAEIERTNISENVKRGMEKAKASGKHIGRPFGHHTPIKLTDAKVKAVQQMKESGVGVTEIAATLNLSRKSVYRALQKKTPA